MAPQPFRKAGLSLLPAVLITLAAVGSQGAAAEERDVRILPPIHLTRYPTIRPYKALPPLPIRLLPYAAIEPDRTLPAHEWHSPYCLRWDDGVESCARAEDRIDRPATCCPIDISESERKQRATIACNTISRADFEMICQEGIKVTASNGVNRTAIFAEIVFEFDRTHKRWRQADGSGFGAHTETKLIRNSTLVETFNLFSSGRWKRLFPYDASRGTELTMCMLPFKATEAASYYLRIRR